MLKNKSSQVQIGETISIIFVFTVLMMFGSLFYFKVLSSGKGMKSEENLQLRAVEIAQKASFLPEIQCSESIVIEGCIDQLKLYSATKIMKENRLFYYDSFGYSQITVNEAYPDQNTWMIYNNTKDKWDNRKATFVPVSIFHPITKKFSFGFINVTVFE